MTEAKRPMTVCVIQINFNEADIFQKAISILISKKRGLFEVESVPQPSQLGIAQGKNIIYLVTSDDPYNFFELGKLFGENLHF